MPAKTQNKPAACTERADKESETDPLYSTAVRFPRDLCAGLEWKFSDDWLIFINTNINVNMYIVITMVAVRV